MPSDAVFFVDSVRLHPFTLRFEPPEAEAAFREDYFERSLLLARLSLVLGVSQIALFGLLDRAMIPAAFREVVLIRGAVCAGVLAVLAYTFAPSFRRLMQGAMAVPPLLAGFGIIWLCVIGQDLNARYDYYGGVMIVLVYAHTLLRLRFVVASAVGGVLIAGNLAAQAAAGTPGLLLVNAAFYLLSTNLTGMVASYALERYARRVWTDAQRQEQTNRELEGVLDGLRTAQAQLVQAEKLAGLGRLTSGVAHELKNPLNFVNNFAGLSVELADELLAEGTVNPDARLADAAGVLTDLRTNAGRIAEHGRRADAIVRGMMEHAGGEPKTRRPFDFNRLVEEHVARALESWKARGPARPAVEVVGDYDPAAGEVEGIPHALGRVVESLVSNALDAVAEKAMAGGDGLGGYVPAVAVRTRRRGGEVRLEVSDNGAGIEDAVRERMFEPFFTTKPPGQGTGLGLSRAYEVVTAGHGGTIRAEGSDGAGALLVVTLPAPLASGEARPALPLVAP